MMHDLILALRNAARNRRRSLVTILALALCCAGLVLFAGYVNATFAADESRTVVATGHLQIFVRNFPEEGIGSPGAFRIENHEELKRRIVEDPVLRPLIFLATGQLNFTGLASHYENGTSTAFVGNGVFPSDYERAYDWNPHRLSRPFEIPVNKLLYKTGPHVSDDDPEGGSLGVGLAEVLRIEPPQMAGKEGGAPVVKKKKASSPQQEPKRTPDADTSGADDLPNFDALQAAVGAPETATDRPTIELLVPSQ